MNKQDQLEELLVDWGLERQQGNELTPEEVCKDNPELVPELSKLISDIKATDWLEEEEEDYSDDDFLHLPDLSTVSGHADETRFPECSLTVEEFCQRLISSRLMDSEQVGQLSQRFAANDARSFAVQLVSEKQLTRFQATVLLEGRDLPLVLDRYVLLAEIGAGGMGAVYKALHQQMDRVVALKILPKEAVDSPDKVKRFQREVKAAAKLEHGNIVTAFDATESNGTHFLVMSYVNGSDLAETVRKQGPVSAAKAVSYISQAASGLEHAHNLGIVHRDIKPGNLLLDIKGTVQILDMGLARIENADPEYDKTVSQELTQAGMVMGTIAYMAPEQALDTSTADAQSDIYSLGCTLYYLLMGKAPYIEGTMMKTIMAHREADIPSLCEERKSVSVELDAVFQKMVAKQPEDRFQNMTEVITALDELEIEDKEEAQSVVAMSPAMHETAFFIDTSQDVIEPQPSSESFGPPRRRWPLITAGVLGAVVLLAGLIIKLSTPAGMVILEVDQPELIGAVVTIDGEKRITIKTGTGQEAIEIRPDAKRHELEVKIAGFKTFAKEFTFETGNKQTISVRLVPLEVARKEEERPAALPTAPDFSIERSVAHQLFSINKDARLVVQTLDNDPVTVNRIEDLPTIHFQVVEIGNSFFQDFQHFDFSQLPKLSKLKFLSLSLAMNIKSSDLNHLRGISSLEILVLNSLPITDTQLKAIAHTSPNLKDIDLNWCSQITGNALIDLAKLPHLEVLGFKDVSLTSQGIAAVGEMRSLTLLDITSSPHPNKEHSAELIGQILKLPKLRSLNVAGISDNELKQLAKHQPLRELAVTGPKVSDAGLEHLKDLTNLQTLNLDNTQVTDAGLVHLKELTSLRTLNLDNTQVTDAGLEHFKGRLTHLQLLNLDNTQVTDAGLEHLKGRLTDLQLLNLDNTQVTDAGLIHLKGRTQLYWLHLKNTQVTDGGVKDLQAALPKCKIIK